jgi:hypothetical protein
MRTSTIQKFCRTAAARFVLPPLFLWLSTISEAAARNFWQQTNGPSGGNIRSLAINNSNGYIFTGTLGGGVFRSMDNGDSWTTVNTSLTNFDVRALGGGIFHYF